MPKIPSREERFKQEYGFLRKISASNLRDLGGHPGRGGKRVRRGHVFRSAHLAEIPEESEVRNLNLQTLVTLQSRMEVSWLGAPDHRVFSSVRWVHIPIGDQWFEDRESVLVTEEDDGERGHLVLVTDFKDAWRAFFELLAEGAVYPLLFHCSAGRDRTGVGAAMLLDMLGVDRKLIVSDFLESNAVFPTLPLEGDMLQPLFDTIDESGGIDGFLRDAIGLAEAPIAKIRSDLLE